MSDSIDIGSSPKSNVLTPWHWGWSAGLVTITLITLAYRYALPLRDGDIWFHLLYARYFVENLTLIPDHTIFSWAPTTNDTIYCAWLSELFLLLLYKIGNITALVAFRYFCVLFFVFAIWRYAKQLQLVRHPFVWLICLTGVLMSYVAVFAKPEIFSYCFFILMAWNWWHIRLGKEESWKNCYLFPLLMLVWVNSHGSFIFGALFLFLIGGAELLNGLVCPWNALPARTRKHLFIAITASGLMIFLTPYGYHYPLQLFWSTMPTEDNLKFASRIGAYTAPLSVAANTTTYTYYADTAVFIFVLLIFLNLKSKKVECSAFLTNLVFAFLYTKFMRTTFFWVPVFAFSSIHLLSLSPSRLQSHKKNARIAVGTVVFVSALFLSYHTVSESYYNPETYCWPGFGFNESVPVEEANFILNNYGTNYRVGNTYDQGSYLLWRFWPKNKVFIDARHFPYRQWIEEYWQFSYGQNVEKFIKKYPCDIWCISLVTSPKACLWFSQSPNWRLAFYGKSSAVFVRKEIPLPEGVPIAGKGIDEIRNIYVGLQCFLFSINIKDYSASQRIVDRVSRYLRTRRPEVVQSINSFYKGVIAYNKGEYTQASLFLAATDRKFIKSDVVLLLAQVQASAEAWQEGRDKEALQISQQAMQLNPYHPYVVFNTAAIEWYLANQAAKAETPVNGDLANEVSPPRWLTLLEIFARETPKNKNTEDFIRIAQGIVEGTYNQRPKLMVPADPGNLTISIADGVKARL